MEIKITAVKQKSSYCKTDSTLGKVMKVTKERYFPFFELMLKELESEQQKNKQRSLVK